MACRARGGVFVMRNKKAALGGFGLRGPNPAVPGAAPRPTRQLAPAVQVESNVPSTSPQLKDTALTLGIINKLNADATPKASADLLKLFLTIFILALRTLLDSLF